MQQQLMNLTTQEKTCLHEAFCLCLVFTTVIVCVQAHEDRNLANKLTPAEKREKKIRKLVGAANEGEAKSVTLFRVTSLAAPQHRFKVRANAEVRNHSRLAMSSFHDSFSP